MSAHATSFVSTNQIAGIDQHTCLSCNPTAAKVALAVSALLLTCSIALIFAPTVSPAASLTLCCVGAPVFSLSATQLIHQTTTLSNATKQKIIAIAGVVLLALGLLFVNILPPNALLIGRLSLGLCIPFLTIALGLYGSTYSAKAYAKMNFEHIVSELSKFNYTKCEARDDEIKVNQTRGSLKDLLTSHRNQQKLFPIKNKVNEPQFFAWEGKDSHCYLLTRYLNKDYDNELYRLDETENQLQLIPFDSLTLTRLF